MELNKHKRNSKSSSKIAESQIDDKQKKLKFKNKMAEIFNSTCTASGV